MGWTVLRNVVAVLAGMFVGMVLNMGLIQLNVVLFPMPEGVGFDDTEAFATYIQGLPLRAFVLVILAHLAQAGVGGLVAAWLGRSRPLLLAMIVGVLTAIGTAANAVMIGAPAWMWLELPLDLAVAWAAGTWVARRRDAA